MLLASVVLTAGSTEHGRSDVSGKRGNQLSTQDSTYRTVPSSPQVKNTCGEASVAILLTRSVWQRKTRVQALASS